MQGVVQFNGYHGCSCLHPSVYFEVVRGGIIKYINLDQQIPARTEGGMVEHANVATDDEEPNNGVKGPTPLWIFNIFQPPCEKIY